MPCCVIYFDYDAQLYGLFWLQCPVVWSILIMMPSCVTYFDYNALLCDLFWLWCPVVWPILITMPCCVTYFDYDAQLYDLFWPHCLILWPVWTTMPRFMTSAALLLDVPREGCTNHRDGDQVVYYLLAVCEPGHWRDRGRGWSLLYPGRRGYGGGPAPSHAHSSGKLTSHCHFRHPASARAPVIVKVSAH